MQASIPLPNDEYLTNIGQIVYSVGYIEWLLLGDITPLDLPGRLSISHLAGMTTGKLGNTLASVSDSEVSDAVLRDWLVKGGNYLVEIAKRRNSILHARPATSPSGDQILFRWIPGEHFFIDNGKLDELSSHISRAISDLNNTRPRQL